MATVPSLNAQAAYDRFLRFHNAYRKRQREEQFDKLKQAYSMRAVVGAVLVKRHDGPCWSDDASLYVEAILPILVHIAKVTRRSTVTLSWMRMFTPGLLDENHKQERERLLRLETDLASRWTCEGIFDSRYRRRTHSYIPSGASIGKALMITLAEIETWELRFVSAHDRTEEMMIERKREQDRAKDARRLARSERKPQTGSAARLELWKHLGVGKTKYYDLKRAGRLPPEPEVARGEDPAEKITAFVKAYGVMTGTVIDLADRFARR